MVQENSYAAIVDKDFADCIFDARERHHPDLHHCHLLHDNVQSHTALLAQQFLAKKQVTVLLYPLFPYDFSLFLHLGQFMKDKQFYVLDDIQDDVTAQLTSIPEEVFPRCFQDLQHHWNCSVTAESDYFKGTHNVVSFY